MSNSPLDQFKILLVKNWKLQKRKKKMTFYQIMMFAFVIVALIFLKFVLEKEVVTTTVLDGAFEVNTDTTYLYPTNQTDKWYLAYTPHSSEAESIIKTASQLLNFSFDQEFGFKDEEQLEKTIYKLDKVFGAVTFMTESLEKKLDKVIYKIRLKTMNIEALKDDFYSKNKVRGTKKIPEMGDQSSYGIGYLRNGFITIQQAVDLSIIKYFNGDYTKVRSFLKKFPSIHQSSGDYVDFLKTHFPFLVMLGTIMVVSTMCYEVAYERETSVKEYLKLIGFHPAIYWLAWVVKYMIVMLVFIIILTFFLHFGVAKNIVIKHTKFSITFIFLLLYSFNVIAFNIFISTLFNKAKKAAHVGVLLSVILYIPHFYLHDKYEIISTRNRMLLCFINIYGLCQGSKIIANFEEIGMTLTWKAMLRGISSSDKLSMAHIIFMQIICFFVYIFLAWLVDSFLSRQHLISRVGPMHESDVIIDENKIHFQKIEKLPVNIPYAIRIQNIIKEFRHAKRPAISSIFLDIIEGDTVAILGSENSGKTTLFSILIGLIPPTRGFIDIYKRPYSFCFKFDIFFEHLTVEENLEVFAKFKGCESKDCSKEVEKMLLNIDLKAHRNMFPKKLSRLLRRKLSLGIAFIADSKLVILEEPTYDFDLESRKDLWDLLDYLQENRCVIITTQYTDEADFLADRIALLEEGKLHCYGTSKYFSDNYDTGCYLNIILAKTSQAKSFDSVVADIIPEATLLHTSAHELNYFLPKKSYDSFINLFDTLESEIESNELKGFGISLSTVDENFSRSSATDIEEVKEKMKSMRNTMIEQISTIQNKSTFDKIETNVSFGNKIKLTCMAKCVCVLRRKLSILFHLFFPLLVAFQFDLLYSLRDHKIEFSTFKLHVKNHEKTIIPYTYAYGLEKSDKKDCLETYLHVNRRTKVFIGSNSLTENIIDYLIIQAKINIYEFRLKYHFGAVIDKKYILGLYSDDSSHNIATSLSMINNAWLTCLVGDNKYFQIETVNHPLPYYHDYKNQEKELLSTKPEHLIRYSMFIFIALFLIHTIQDRFSGLKSVQNIGRLNTMFYWLATFILDFILHIIFTFFLVAFLVNKNSHGYSDLAMVKYSIIFSMLFGFAALPFIYVLSFFFKNPKKGFLFLILFFLLTYMLGNLKMLEIDNENFKTAAKYSKFTKNTLKFVFPFLLFADGVKKLFVNYENYQLFLQCLEKQEQFCTDTDSNYLGWQEPGVLSHIVIFILNCIFYFLLLTVVETDVLRRLRFIYYAKHNERITARKKRDALAKSIMNGPKKSILKNNFYTREELRKRYEARKALEEQRKSEEIIDTKLLEIKELYKLYSKNSEAIGNLNLKVEEEEIFCVLGLDGAGKSSLLKMIAGIETITHGTIFVNGINVEKKLGMTQKIVGYSPQHHALIDQMTMRENLILHADLKGTKKSKITSLTDAIMRKFGLYTYKHHYIQNLSEINRRKLAIAIAAIGDPMLLLLDEPTEGMDLKSKREIWNCIYQISKTGITILIATNNVQECDALSTKMAIMINGKFRFLGDSQSIKEYLTVRFSLLFESFDKENAVQIHSFVKRFYPDAVLQRMKNGTFKYYIKKGSHSESFGDIFTHIENNKVDLNIKRYTVYYSCLEYLFFSLNKKARQKIIR